ncbi:hypothetical protein [Paenibacillus sp. N3.4]|uniref:hypothetical protein n=1 Tax=Paenibacillus sp. N3.4 TaxID=2603222 RepID=UPI0011CBBE0B|nr:hypothetical protein [Paenibacillus sp. N3.4]TXK76970.1 hypothetical protein FU659_24155 [Paenibacillus sp. N3.4]
MDDSMKDVDVFLQTIHKLEEKVVKLIHQSNLKEEEKTFILRHILIVPGKDQEHEDGRAIS